MSNTLHTLYQEIYLLKEVSPPDFPEIFSRIPNLSSQQVRHLVHELSSSAFSQANAHAMNLLVDFLRDPSRLCHPQINQLVTLLWRLVGNHEITTVPDQWNLRRPSQAFVIFGSRVQQIALIVFPLNFLALVKRDPMMQLGAVVNMASQGRDYFSHHLDPHTQVRARAYEAELLTLLPGMHQREYLTWQNNAYQDEVVRDYPCGLSSLPSPLQYPTPTYPTERVRHAQDNEHTPSQQPRPENTEGLHVFRKKEWEQ